MALAQWYSLRPMRKPEHPDEVQSPKRKTNQYRCRDCANTFTVKTGTIMHNSKLPLSKWVLAFYLFSTSLKGRSARGCPTLRSSKPSVLQPTLL